MPSKFQNKLNAQIEGTLRLNQEDRDNRLREQAALLKPVLGQLGGPAAAQIGGAVLSGNRDVAEFGANQFAGIQALLSGQEPQQGLGQVQDPSPKDFTPSSLREFVKTNDPGVLVPLKDELAEARLGLSADRLALQQDQFLRLPDADRRSLADTDINLAQLQDIQNGFDESYVGFGSNNVGDAAIAYERRFGDSFDMVDWWQQYNQWRQSFIRSDAGANLTAIEVAAFNRFTIQPGDQPEIARRNISRQIKLTRRAMRMQVRALRRQGFDVSEPASDVVPGISDLTDEELMRLSQ